MHKKMRRTSLRKDGKRLQAAQWEVNGVVRRHATPRQPRGGCLAGSKCFAADRMLSVRQGLGPRYGLNSIRLR